MNYKMMGRFLSFVFFAEAVFMLPSLFLAIFEEGREKTILGFAVTMGILAFLGGILLLLTYKAPKGFFAKEGLFCAALCWLIMSLFGCLPFVISGEIPNYVDALFEMVSGFTTTGASVVTNVEGLSRAVLYWRSFSHWLGGMGVLVLFLAIVPAKQSSSLIHIFRAESPGPDVSKISAKLSDTAKVLYLTYIILTVLNFVFLLFAPDMNVFEAICTSMGTAGTGGFGLKNDSLASYSSYVQWVTAVFMMLFGINFSIYFFLIVKRTFSILKDEEMLSYIGFVLFSATTIVISLIVTNTYTSVGDAIRDAFFTVTSLISTTGYSTADFNNWPTYTKAILLAVMVTGACAGSTCGGLKFSRIILIFKNIKRTVARTMHPKKVQTITVNGKPISEEVVTTTTIYLAVSVVIVFFSFLIISIFDNQSVETNFTAVLATFNNIGPGLGAVGPTGSYADFSAVSKIVMIFDMLAGRLEIFPLLVLFSPSLWKGLKKDYSTPMAETK